MLRRRALGEDKMKIPEIATKPMSDKPKMPTPGPPPMPKMPAEAISASQQPSINNPEPVLSSAAAPVEPTETAANAPALPTEAEIATEKVEFSQVMTTASTPKPEVKKISVDSKNVASKLDALRDLYTGKPKDKKQKGGAADPLAALLGVSSREENANEIVKKLKIRLEPSEIEILQNLAVDFHLTGGNIHKRFSNALNVTLEGKSNPKRVLLRIEIEILKK